MFHDERGRPQLLTLDSDDGCMTGSSLTDSFESVIPAQTQYSLKVQQYKEKLELTRRLKGINICEREVVIADSELMRVLGVKKSRTLIHYGDVVEMYVLMAPANEQNDFSYVFVFPVIPLVSTRFVAFQMGFLFHSNARKVFTRLFYDHFQTKNSSDSDFVTLFLTTIKTQPAEVYRFMLENHSKFKNVFSICCQQWEWPSLFASLVHIDRQIEKKTYF